MLLFAGRYFSNRLKESQKQIAFGWNVLECEGKDKGKGYNGNILWRDRERGGGGRQREKGSNAF